jgi:hypothetical protein
MPSTCVLTGVGFLASQWLASQGHGDIWLFGRTGRHTYNDTSMQISHSAVFGDACLTFMRADVSSSEDVASIINSGGCRPVQSMMHAGTFAQDS